MQFVFHLSPLQAQTSFIHSPGTPSLQLFIVSPPLIFSCLIASLSNSPEIPWILSVYETRLSLHSHHVSFSVLLFCSRSPLHLQSMHRSREMFYFYRGTVSNMWGIMDFWMSGELYNIKKVKINWLPLMCIFIFLSEHHFDSQTSSFTTVPHTYLKTQRFVKCELYYSLSHYNLLILWHFMTEQDKVPHHF